MPDRMSNRMSEDMSDRMPEDLPVRKCINVMVGITRSKVIYLFLEEHGGTWRNISDSDLRRFFQMAQIVPRDLRMLYPDASATQLHQADNIGLFSYVIFK